MDWKELESKVADIFKLFGYDIVRNTKIDSAQTDVIAMSKNKFKPRILIECKYHESEKNNVGINEVENFRARVLTLRMLGKIDQGYLITNTDFTPSAKESIAESSTYVFLSKFNDLLYQMVDVDYYLKNFVEQYENTRLSKYVDLRIVNIDKLESLNYDYAVESFYLDHTLKFPDVDKVKITLEDGEERETFTEKKLDWNIIISIENDLRPHDTEYLDINTIKEYHDNYKTIYFFDKKIISKKIISFKKREFIDYKKNRVKNIELFSTYIQSFIKSNHNISIVLGDFGSGKSTSLEHIMYLLAKERLSNSSNTKAPIPILLTLKNYNKVLDIDSLLVNFFNSEIGYSNINLQVFKKMNELGYFVMLLDGFDEMSRLVTPIERRLTFIELCKLITNKNKLILSSRPGYFPENKELGELLRKYIPREENMINKHCGIDVPANCQIGCLQLMDDEKIKEYILKAIGSDENKVLNTLKLKSVHDLATRPVLLNIISETSEELKKVPEEKVTLKTLYDIYTNKWINREEDKGFFRILINPEKKLAFIVLLAIQMYEQDNLKIHFSALDKLIRDKFGIDNQEQVDHFSHDIRTCTFLNRDDSGYYSFIHKSFLEYFIAREFHNLSSPIYKSRFERPFSPEIMSFIDINSEELLDIFSCYCKISKRKNEVVKKQRFELAVELRGFEKDILKEIQRLWPDYKAIKEVNQKFELELLKKLKTEDID